MMVTEEQKVAEIANIRSNTRVQTLRSAVLSTLNERERMLLIIYLMLTDKYDADKMYEVIDDVLYLGEIEKLVSRLKA